MFSSVGSFSRRWCDVLCLFFVIVCFLAGVSSDFVGFCKAGSSTRGGQSVVYNALKGRFCHSSQSGFQRALRVNWYAYAAHPGGCS